MSRRLPDTIRRNPELSPAEDYYRLRREGIGHIEKMTGRRWTDYNVHDPGITILESLCYAITDLAYRIGWDIKDLLAPHPDGAGPGKPYAGQAFFPAREILTVNATTADDFSRLLINVDAVRDAWIACRECACDAGYYAWCSDDRLHLSFEKPADVTPELKQVSPRGLYDVLLELETDPELGDLNDRKIELRFTIAEPGHATHPFTVELRFPEWRLDNELQWTILRTITDFSTLRVSKLGAATGEDILKLPEDKQDESLRRHWRQLFHVAFALDPAAGEKIEIENATLRLFGDSFVRKEVTCARLLAILEDKYVEDFPKPKSEFIRRYREKEIRKQDAVDQAKKALHAHRNLDEDYCCVKTVGIEEVGVCADIEVKPDADIERVQAEIWFRIEQYFNPRVPFRSLKEMLDSGEAVEDTFNGPPLDCGFIKAADLESATSRSVLRGSDIVNLVMDVEGVNAVNQLQMTKYDAEGRVIKGAADPTFADDGTPVFDAGKISASWLLYLGGQNQPRLYLNESRLYFLKNGLPFLPRMDESLDTLTQLRGMAERPKIGSADNDLPVPAGSFRDPGRYTPVQNGFPLAYGIGRAGLPFHASARRNAQAKQLKAYLMVYEQLLGNAFAQIANAKELFSLDSAGGSTYFPKVLKQKSGDEETIQGYDEIVAGLDKPKLQELLETVPERLERRNRFLDHLMARFGERFGEYPLLFTGSQSRQASLEKLIEDKTTFLLKYSRISRDRGRSFNYTDDPTGAGNLPVLNERIGLLLGSADLKFTIVEHLLLRPKFPGDALYPACAEGTCTTCGEEDPYSFRLTFVMPGWEEPFKGNMEMRNFTDRTIRQETPSHLLGKICWVGNDGIDELIDNRRGATVRLLAGLVEEHAGTAAGQRPTEDDARACAESIHGAFKEAFTRWYQQQTSEFVYRVAVRAALLNKFGEVDRTAIPCAATLDDPLWANIRQIMAEDYADIVLHARQFDRFNVAWREWLRANFRIDWTGERLQDRVEAVLASNAVPRGDTEALRRDELCRSATVILENYGVQFYGWMDANFRNGRSFEYFKERVDFPDRAASGCPDFREGTEAKLSELLEAHYTNYVEASYWLWIVVTLLSRLRNVYPPATLHDWDEGDDRNPVRLGSTALGS